jgi:hypothetical protein
MRTPSMRTLAALAYERGEEFDTGIPPSPGLLQWLATAEAAVAIESGPGPYELSRRRARERRAENRRVPDWFSASDVVDAPVARGRGAVMHGEVV